MVRERRRAADRQPDGDRSRGYAVLLEVFGRGETIVIPNIEDVKTQMPSEYEILKTQSVHSEIAVPVFYRGQSERLFGLDNPQRR